MIFFSLSANKDTQINIDTGRYGEFAYQLFNNPEYDYGLPPVCGIIYLAKCFSEMHIA